jgi:hypothetical protein
MNEPRFVLKPGWEAQVRHSAAVGAGLEAATQQMVSEAQAIAPVGPPTPGTFRDSIQSKVEEAEDGYRGWVFSDDFKAKFLEWGTEDTPAFHIFQRAAEATGLRWRPANR